MNASYVINPKCLFYFLLITATIFLLPIKIFPQWYPQTSGTTEDLNSIFFTDSLNGFAVGNDGTVIRTIDGGLTWNFQILDSNYHLKDVFFLDDQNGWICGHSTEPYQQGRVYRTSNGGGDWEEIAKMEFSDIIFLDTLVGLAAGSSIFKTTDGAVSWEQQFGYYYPVFGFHFDDSLCGWAAGGWINGSTGYMNSYILNTTDGGDTWEYQFEYSGWAGAGFILYNICFTDSLHGFAVGSGPAGVKRIILITSNGGLNWETLYSDDHHGRLYDICFPDPQNGLVVGGFIGGVIMHMEYADELWSMQTTLTENKLNSICFPDGNNGWIVGNNGTILHNNPTVQVAEFNEPTDYNFLDVYPNPFSTSIIFEFETAQAEQVEISIYNQLGEMIQKEIINTQPGRQTFTWDAKDLPSGIYFIRTQVGNELITRKMIKLN